MTFFIYIAISSFAGKWSGQYTGTDQGTWNVTVSDDGEISGTGQSTRLGTIFGMEGNVSKDGSFKATIGTVATGSEFTGKDQYHHQSAHERNMVRRAAVGSGKAQ
ncbi:hypothetical protein GCM10011386_28730 [Parapedobacter defluvii]|uniref:Uncharacterized protein n=1 Tax=Parapedobacter defluvii TaxID=2045106 RepID=A0ABQ1M765_9SPHI|nr:hypothetical protein [Parapedobacter defluvii]RQP13777.1 MAG: hypothetical protein EAS52_18845 [Parapedobacter sp.]GGC34850.1 hypothetical protein GCM10011386_28730 [Parapedobacter defluvii]